MSNMNMPPIDLPPLRQTLTTWAGRSGILLGIVVVWVLWLGGPIWLLWAWAAFAVGTLALAMALRRMFGHAEKKPADRHDA